VMKPRGDVVFSHTPLPSHAFTPHPLTPHSLTISPVILHAFTLHPSRFYPHTLKLFTSSLPPCTHSPVKWKVKDKIPAWQNSYFTITFPCYPH